MKPPLTAAVSRTTYEAPGGTPACRGLRHVVGRSVDRIDRGRSATVSRPRRLRRCRRRLGTDRVNAVVRVRRRPRRRRRRLRRRAADLHLARLEVDALAAGGVADLLAGGLQTPLLLIHVPLGRIEEGVEAPLRHGSQVTPNRPPMAAAMVAAPTRCARSLDGMLFSRHKTELVDHGPRAARTRRLRVHRPGHALRQRSPDPAAVPGAPACRPSIFGLGLLLGRRGGLLAAARRVDDRGRLRRRLHPAPELRGGLLRADRAHRGRARRATTRSRSASPSSSRPSSRCTTRPRACARATTSARSTARRSTTPTTRSARSPSGRRRSSAQTLTELGYDKATTEIAPAGEFYYAEDYHQQYLAKNPNGYRCHATTGVHFPLDKLTATA